MSGICKECHCSHIGPDGHPTGFCGKHNEPVTLNHGCHACAGRDIATLRARLRETELEVESRNAALEHLQDRLDTAERECDRMARRVVRHIAEDQDVPYGWKPAEAWTDGDEVIILGLPQDGHSCDQMGCGNIGIHVINRCLLHAVPDAGDAVSGEDSVEVLKARLAQAKERIEAADDAIRFGYAPQLHDMEAKIERLQTTIDGYLRTLIMVVDEIYCERVGDDPEQDTVIMMVLAWLTEAGVPWPEGCTEQWTPAEVPGSVRLPFRMSQTQRRKCRKLPFAVSRTKD